MLKKIYDDRFQYPGYWRKDYDAFCQLTVYLDEQTGASIIIATEDDSNQGLSVTNGIERIATLARRQFDLDRAQMQVIEHYPAARQHARTLHRSIDPEHFTRVHLTPGERRENTLVLDYLSADWSPVTVEEVARLTEDQSWLSKEKLKPDD